MKILEKKSVEVNFTESLLRMAADDVEGIYLWEWEVGIAFKPMFSDIDGCKPTFLCGFSETNVTLNLKISIENLSVFFFGTGFILALEVQVNPVLAVMNPL